MRYPREYGVKSLLTGIVGGLLALQAVHFRLLFGEALTGSHRLPLLVVELRLLALGPTRIAQPDRGPPHIVVQARPIRPDP